MRRETLLAMTVLILVGSWEGASAQASKPPKAKQSVQAEVAAASVDTAPAVDTTEHDSLPKKKGGLFGKAKGVMKNKVVQQVAKVAACNMVPGGQMIVGALDAASSKSAGEAASGAAGAATGSSCMPGMGGAGMGAAGMTGAGMAAGGMGGGGMGGLVGAGLAGATMGGMPGGAAAYAPGTGAPGMPPMGGYGMGGDPKPMADCMGLTVEEYNAMTNPTNSEPRQMTKAETKRMQQLSKKVGSQRQMGCSQQVGMQQASAQMAMMQQMMAQAQAQGGMPGMHAAAMSEAPGQAVEIAADLPAELKKGKTVVRGIDWVAASAEVSPAGRAEFDEAMVRLAQAIKESGQRYRLDLYVDQASEAQGSSRLQLVQTTLTASLGDPAAVEIGKTKRDKNPRLEVVKAK